MDPAYGCSLVPVDAGPDLEDHLAFGQHEERMIGGHQRLQDGLDLLTRALGGPAIVDCRGQALALDLNARQEQRQPDELPVKLRERVTATSCFGMLEPE